MATSIRISEELVNQARKYSQIAHRSLPGQVEYWARIGKCAEENPDLTYNLVKELTSGVEELAQGDKSVYELE